ncbi:fimbrial protein [Burkholderia seminalis]|uniref:fimbrial protein n=1 Tax=Burkholderia seminalis TaxID=488731 RepID=UPI000F59093C|nr:fimbrial protein [Burkholderia seminalis]MCA8424745.1 fimbrial protein [Burkholderia seminalis]RQS95434.1 fimbrial protein [Burkholderia seminalis]
MKYLIFIVAIAMGNVAQATCTIQRTDGVYVESLIVTLPKFNPPPFDPDIPEGAVIFSSGGASTGLGGSLNCTSQIGGLRYVGTLSATPGKYSTYPTPVAGVGVRIRGGIKDAEWWPVSDYWYGTTGRFEPGASFTIELVKTGDITAPGTLIGEIGKTEAWLHNAKVRSIVTNGAINIIPRVPTCNLLTSKIAVNLGVVSLADFKGPGTSSPPKSFEVRLKCSGGNPGTATRMFMTLTDAANPANRSNTLSLAPGSKAEGFGIQIVRGADNTLVSYGPDSSAVGNPNQWEVGKFGNVGVTIPFKAQYVRTSAQLKGGNANGFATFTMSYQ